MQHLIWGKFEVVAIAFGLLGGALIGGLWFFAPAALAALPDANDMYYHMAHSVPWTGYLWESIWQQLAKAPLLACATIVLVVLMVLRPLARFFGDGN